MGTVSPQDFASPHQKPGLGLWTFLQCITLAALNKQINCCFASFLRFVQNNWMPFPNGSGGIKRLKQINLWALNFIHCNILYNSILTSGPKLSSDLGLPLKWFFLVIKRQRSFNANRMKAVGTRYAGFVWKYLNPAVTLFNINAAENKCITADSWLSADIQNENSRCYFAVNTELMNIWFGLKWDLNHSYINSWV